VQSNPKRKPPRAGRPERLGIFGGTFDPVHYGHLICAEQLREAIGLDLVVFVPCSRSPHKPDYVPATDRHRLAMLELAVRAQENFRVSDVEIDRGGLSYTVDTLATLRSQFGPDADFWLLMGMDAYLDLPAWKQPDEIVAQCRFGVARRPGYAKKLDPALPVAKTQFVDITPVDISSTGVREKLAQGRSIAFLVPEAVAAYIRKNRPYPAPNRTENSAPAGP
jgi:nicotinate-nucleotide adenylyltransferase